MSPLRRESSPAVARARAVGLLLVLATGLSLSIHGLLLVVAHRVPLAVLFGARLTVLLVALALSVAAGAVVLVVRLLALLRGRGAPVRWRPLRVLIYLLFLGAVAFVLWCQPYRTIVVQAAAGICAGLYALLVSVADALAARLPRRLRALLNIAVLNLCVLAVGTELGLRIWAEHHPSPFFAQRDASARAMVETYRLKPEHARTGYPVNSSGEFDSDFHPKVPGTPLAVTIGDSFSASIVPHVYHFTTVAERALGLGPVIANIGVPAIGPREYLYLLRTEALPLHPDVVVVDIFVGNDITAPHDETEIGGVLRSWLDRDQLLIVSVARVLTTLSSEPAAHAALQGTGRLGDGSALETRGESPAGAPDSATTGATTGAIAGADPDAVSPQDLERLYPWLSDPMKEVEGEPAPAYLKLEFGRARDVCSERPAPWSAVFALLSEMKAACGSTPFAVMIIPDEFQVEDDVWKDVRAAAGDEWLERDLPQRILGDWLAAQKIPTLDLLPVLRAVPPLADGRRHLYHLRETHFNVRGNAATGAALADFLRPYLGGAAAGAAR